MNNAQIKKLGGIALAVTITGGVGYQQFQNIETPTPSDPLAQILQENKAINLTGDFTTDTAPVPYEGPISETLQKCIDTPLEASQNIDDAVYAPFNRGANITQTNEEILADIGPVLGHAVQNNEISWKWNAFAKTYEFKGNPEDAKLWYCYFKEDSEFFKEFLSTDEISVPFNDITTISFQEKLPEVTIDGDILKTETEKNHVFEILKDNITGELDLTKITLLDEFETKKLDRIKNKIAKETESFEKFEKLKSQNKDLLSPKLADIDFWDSIEKQKEEVQKVSKFAKEIGENTHLIVTELVIDTTKDFSIDNLEQELKDIIKVTKVIDPDTNTEKFLLELSKDTSTGTDINESYIESIKLKAVGDILASTLTEGTDESTIENATALYELVIELNELVPAGTEYQAVIEGNILPSVINDGGLAIENPITEPVFSQINTVDGADEITCPTTPEPICGIETELEAVEAGHDDIQLKTYTNKCEFKKAGATFVSKSVCTTEDQEEFQAELAELDS